MVPIKKDGEDSPSFFGMMFYCRRDLSTAPSKQPIPSFSAGLKSLLHFRQQFCRKKNKTEKQKETKFKQENGATAKIEVFPFESHLVQQTMPIPARRYLHIGTHYRANCQHRSRLLLLCTPWQKPDLKKAKQLPRTKDIHQSKTAAIACLRLLTPTMSKPSRFCTVLSALSACFGTRHLRNPKRFASLTR